MDKVKELINGGCRRKVANVDGPSCSIALSPNSRRKDGRGVGASGRRGDLELWKPLLREILL